MDLDYIITQGKAAPLHQHHVAKEALQQCLLAALSRQGFLTNVAFIGGTALRILHRLPRFSEDLDFAWIGPKPTTAIVKEWSATIQKAVSKIGLTAHLSTKGPSPIDALVEKRGFTIYLAATSTAPEFIRLARNGIQISFEIDLNPPDHLVPERKTLLVANEQVTLQSLTLPSLMAGKLHILLTRKDREKGRDWYDYLWYRRNNITPHLPQLQSAIDQTAAGPEAHYWMSFIRARTHQTNWLNVQSDAGSFLEKPEDAHNLNAVAIRQITPYPNFEQITAELYQLKQQHSLLKTESPVLSDINQAATEGNETAIETRSVIEAIRGIENDSPSKEPEI
jgi:hypothetical protein